MVNAGTADYLVKPFWPTEHRRAGGLTAYEYKIALGQRRLLPG